MAVENNQRPKPNETPKSPLVYPRHHGILSAGGETRFPPVSTYPTTPDFWIQSLSKEERRAAKRDEVMRSLEPLAGTLMKEYMGDPNKLWYADKFLPDFSKPEGIDELRELQEQAKGISDEVWVVYVGHEATERALSNYESALNRVDAIADKSGIDQHNFAKWIRAWTAEEDRHGIVLDRYLYMTGRVNQQAVEKSVYSLLANGMDPQVDHNPYNAIAYVAAQEEATRVSHANMGRLAAKQGAEKLVQICGHVASDERRHRDFYVNLLKGVAEVDPDEAVIALKTMLLDKQIIMPAALITDGEPVPEHMKRTPLFRDFSNVSNAIGTYTPEHYVGIIRYLRKVLDIDHLKVETDEGKKAQDAFGKYTEEYGKRLDKSMTERELKRNPEPKFPWINDRSVSVLHPTITLRKTA